MADTPTPNAMLADECAKASYETYDDGQDDYSDLFRRAAAALRAPTIAAPSPSKEVTEEMVEAAQAARMAHAERCVDPEVCVDDHGPHETWHGCNFNSMHDAIEAALKAHKPSPSQADDAERCACGAMFVGRGSACESCQRVIGGDKAGDDAALVARLRNAHQQIVHTVNSHDCAICDAADCIEALSAEVLEKRTQAANEIIAAHELRQKLRSATPQQVEERCESCRKVLGRGWKYDSTGEVKLCPRCYAELRREGAALATPPIEEQER